MRGMIFLRTVLLPSRTSNTVGEARALRRKFYINYYLETAVSMRHKIVWA